VRRGAIPRFGLDPLFPSAPRRFSGAPVIGTIRDTEGAPTRFSAFCLDLKSGEVWLVDLGDLRSFHFVASTVGKFIRQLRLFHDRWQVIVDTDRDHGEQAGLAEVERFSRDLKRIDARAFWTPPRSRSYWAEWIEDLRVP
jgi:hypothetical protein